MFVEVKIIYNAKRFRNKSVFYVELVARKRSKMSASLRFNFAESQFEFYKLVAGAEESIDDGMPTKIKVKKTSHF